MLVHIFVFVSGELPTGRDHLLVDWVVLREVLSVGAKDIEIPGIFFVPCAPAYENIVSAEVDVEVHQLYHSSSGQNASQSYHAAGSPSHRRTQAQSSYHTKRTIQAPALLDITAPIKRIIYPQGGQPYFGNGAGRRTN